jgi:hypothetical protein
LHTDHEVTHYLVMFVWLLGSQSAYWSPDFRATPVFKEAHHTVAGLLNFDIADISSTCLGLSTFMAKLEVYRIAHSKPDSLHHSIHHPGTLLE